MKKIICLILGILLFSTSIFSQESQTEDSVVVPLEEIVSYRFETIREHPITSIRPQSIENAHWYYSGLSFMESEILLKTADEYDLSELYLLSSKYYDKVAQYVRSEGKAEFSMSNSWEDVLRLLNTHGIVPESEMPSEKVKDNTQLLKEMKVALKGYANALVENSISNPSEEWKKGCQGIIDAYLGKKPSNFKANDEDYTPQNFLKSVYIDLNDYVVITSWNTRSYFNMMNLNETDSRESDRAYNVPLKEMVEIINYALENGYTIAWTCDATEEGFTQEGVAVVPDMGKIQYGNDFAVKPCKEIEVTDKMRQTAYNDYSTKADYTMHIYGTAKDQNGTLYYMAKNPKGNIGKYGGVWYISKEYLKYKTFCSHLKMQ